MKSKVKYEKPDCPICGKNKDVISDGNSWSSGMVGIANKGSHGAGSSSCSFYCTKCFVDFNIEINYKRYSKAKIMGGITGYTG